MAKKKAKRTVIKRTTWVCPICDGEYTTRAEAAGCLAYGVPEPAFKVGDIVYLGYHKTGWYDGDKRWIRRSWPQGRPGQKDHLDFGHDFYYVVVEIGQARNEPHQRRYVLVTEAMTASYRVHYEDVGPTRWWHRNGTAKRAQRVPKTVRAGVQAVLAWWEKHGENWKAGKMTG